MRDAMSGMIEGVENFRNTFVTFPRVSTSMTRAAREAQSVLQELIIIARGGASSLEQALEIIS